MAYEKLIEKFKLKNPTIEIFEDSIRKESSPTIRENCNSKNKYPYADMRCKECGHIWRANIFSYTSSHNVGCPKCKLLKGAVKRKDTLMERYGTLNTHEGDKKEPYLRKCEATFLEKYGETSIFKTKEFKEKQVKTNLEKYGVKYAFHTKESLQKSKATLRKLYGVDYPMQNASIMEKARQTVKSRYGVDNPMQCRDIYLKQCKNKYYEYDNLRFDSSWELAFYIWHQDNSIPIIRDPVTELTYEDCNGNIHRYFPDFSVNGKLFEIKSHNWWKSKDDNYKKLVEKVSIVIDNDSIKPYNNYCREKYGSKDWYVQFRKNK